LPCPAHISMYIYSARHYPALSCTSWLIKVYGAQVTLFLLIIVLSCSAFHILTQQSRSTLQAWLCVWDYSDQCHTSVLALYYPAQICKTLHYNAYLYCTNCEALPCPTLLILAPYGITMPISPHLDSPFLCPARPYLDSAWHHHAQLTSSTQHDSARHYPT
jgi:hypothetical protein